MELARLDIAQAGIWTAVQAGETRAEPEPEDRALQAARLRLDGKTFQEIADELGYANKSGAQKADGAWTRSSRR